MVTKPRTGATLLSLSHALTAVAELMTKGHAIHGGTWEGGRLSDPDCIEKCNDSLARHLLTTGIDHETGMPHDVAVAANALICLERRLRDETIEHVAVHHPTT